MRSARSAYWLGVVAPLVLVVLVLTLDAAIDEKTQFVGLLVAMPMLAAVFVRPLPTAFVGLFAFLAALLFGLFLAVDGTGSAQSIRLVAIAFFTLVAVSASTFRVRSEAALADARQVAEAVSLAVLRPVPDQVSGVPVRVSYTSAHRAANVGGDLYEVSSTPYGVRLVVGDVRGKGLGAVQLVSVALGSFREASHHLPSLVAVSDRVAGSVAREGGDEDFVTGVVAELAPDNSATFVSAGHPPPLLFRDGVAQELDLPPSPPWGIPGEASSRTFALLPGDRVLIYTDGVTEARSKEDRLVFFPLLSEAATALAAPTLEGALSNLEAALRRFTGGRLTDDAALVLLEVPSR